MAEQLKNMYSTEFVENLVKHFKKQEPNFQSTAFRSAVLNENWDNLELKARTEHIAAQFALFLPYDFKQQIAILTEIAPHFGGFTGTVFPTFVEKYGLSDRETSLRALEQFTPFSTSEFAIRPFLIRYPDAINQLYRWSKSENYHVRRLASEGCRPLLPWAMKLHDFVKDPSPILPILETLRNDPHDYVYRSVANNLNDISKHHPELVLDLCEKWIHDSKTTQWVAKHALRTLLKKGNQRALQLFGFAAQDAAEIIKFELKEREIKIGDATEFKLAIKNKDITSKWRLEYVIGYLKKNGQHSEKVFQLRETVMKSGEVIELTKKLDFKNLTTRKHYEGEHYIDLKLNGVVLNRRTFLLTCQ